MAKDKKEKRSPVNTFSSLELLMVRDRVIDLYYRGGYTVDEIAAKLNMFKNNVRHIIDDEEEAKKIPAVLKKVEPRKPNMYMVYDKERNRVWYDITEYVLDTPGKFGDPSQGRVKAR